MVERVIECAEQIDVEIERFYELFAEIGVQASRHFLYDFHDNDKRTVEDGHDIVIFLLLVVLFHFEADHVV